MIFCEIYVLVFKIIMLNKNFSIFFFSDTQTTRLEGLFSKTKVYLSVNQVFMFSKNNKLFIPRNFYKNSHHANVLAIFQSFIPVLDDSIEMEFYKIVVPSFEGRIFDVCEQSQQSRMNVFLLFFDVGHFVFSQLRVNITIVRTHSSIQFKCSKRKVFNWI